MRYLIGCAVLLTLGCLLLLGQRGAVDFSGVWKLEMQQADDSKGDTLLDLKMEGSKLTGMLKSPQGEFPIENGSVQGQDLFFNVVIQREEYKLKTTYRGHLFSEEIQFNVEAGERLLLAIARRAK
jgi:hypothetical protein